MKFFISISFAGLLLADTNLADDALTVHSYSRHHMKTHGQQMHDKFVSLHGSPKESKSKQSNKRQSDIDDINYYRENGYECYSYLNNEHYKAGQEWDAYKAYKPNLQAGVPENEMHAVLYHCRCIGGDRGTFRCKPQEVPCHDKDNSKIYGENEMWDIEREVPLPNSRRTITDIYECQCRGGRTGKYSCSQKDIGCIDHHWTFKKYLIHEQFQQDRNGVLHDCECKMGMADDIREIACSSNNYCRYEGNHYQVGETFQRFNPDTHHAEADCTCNRGETDESNTVVCTNIYDKVDINKQQIEHVIEAEMQNEYQKEEKIREIDNKMFQRKKEFLTRKAHRTATVPEAGPSGTVDATSEKNNARRQKPQRRRRPKSRSKLDRLQILALLKRGEQTLQENSAITNEIRERHGFRKSDDDDNKFVLSHGSRRSNEPVIVKYQEPVREDYNKGVSDSADEDYEIEEDDEPFQDSDENY